MDRAAGESYPFIEVSMACSDAAAMEAFWEKMFAAKVLFRGRMMGHPFSRILACGVTLVFREDPDFQAPSGPGQEFNFCNHLGLRVKDLETAISDLETRGAQSVLTPELVRRYQGTKKDGGDPFLETDYISPPLTAERIAAGEYAIDLAIMVGPDNLWIELNQITEPEDTNWFPFGEGRNEVG